METVTLGGIVNIRKFVAKLIENPLCKDYQDILVIFLNDTKFYDESYMEQVQKVAERYCEREANGAVKLKDDCFIVLPENQTKFMKDIQTIKSTVLKSEKVLKAMDSLGAIILPEEEWKKMLEE